MNFLTFTDGLIIGAVITTGIVCEYRWARALTRQRNRKADHVSTSPRVVGQNFDNPNRMEWTWPSK